MDYQEKQNILESYTDGEGFVECSLTDVFIDTDTGSVMVGFENPVGEEIFLSVKIEWYYLGRLKTPIFEWLCMNEFEPGSRLRIRNPSNSTNCEVKFKYYNTIVYPVSTRYESPDEFSGLVSVAVVREMVGNLVKHPESNGLGYVVSISEFNESDDRVLLEVEDTVTPVDSISGDIPFSWDVSSEFIPTVRSCEDMVVIVPDQYNLDVLDAYPSVDVEGNWVAFPFVESEWEFVYSL